MQAVEVHAVESSLRSVRIDVLVKGAQPLDELHDHLVAPPCSVTRERLRRWSVRNPHSTDQLPERMWACSDRLFGQPAVRSRDTYLADPPELQPQLLRRRSVATP